MRWHEIDTSIRPAVACGLGNNSNLRMRLSTFRLFHSADSQLLCHDWPLEVTKMYWLKWKTFALNLTSYALNSGCWQHFFSLATCGQHIRVQTCWLPNQNLQVRARVIPPVVMQCHACSESQRTLVQWCQRRIPQAEENASPLMTLILICRFLHVPFTPPSISLSPLPHLEVFHILEHMTYCLLSLAKSLKVSSHLLDGVHPLVLRDWVRCPLHLTWSVTHISDSPVSGSGTWLPSGLT